MAKKLEPIILFQEADNFLFRFHAFYVESSTTDYKEYKLDST